MLDPSKREILQISNLIAFILMILVNWMSGLRIFNGKTVGEISDKYPNLFTPAAITFAIWGVIYTFIFLFVIYQARDIFKSQKEEIPYIEKVNILFVLSCIFNILWLIIWLFEFILLSLVVMIALLLVLIIIYLHLDIARADIDLKDKIFVWVPFSLYLGWITIAAVANTSVFLVSINWDGFGISPLIWTVIVIIIVISITLTIIYTRKDIIFPLVVIWASIGIIIRRIETNFELVIVALFTIIIVAINLVFLIVKKSKDKKFKKE